VSCNKIEGALYFFPRLHLPNLAIKTAESEGVSPDVFYTHRLLDATGIAVVPGTGFHQVSQSEYSSQMISPLLMYLKGAFSECPWGWACQYHHFALRFTR